MESEVKSILLNTNCMYYADGTNTKINLIYVPESKFYHASIEAITKIAKIYDDSVDVIPLITERTVYETAGLNVKVKGIDLTVEDNYLGVVKIFAKLIKDKLATIPNKFSVYIKDDNLVIPAIMMPPKDREFLIRVISDQKILASLCKEREVPEFSFVYQYDNLLITPNKLVKVILRKDEIDIVSGDLSKFSMMDISVLLSNSPNVERVNTKLAHNLISTIEYDRFNQTKINVSDDIQYAIERITKEHPEIWFLHEIITQIITLDEFLSQERSLQFGGISKIRYYMSALIPDKDSVFNFGKIKDDMKYLLRHYFVEFSRRVGKKYEREHLAEFVKSMRAHKDTEFASEIDIINIAKALNEEKFKSIYVLFIHKKIEWSIRQSSFDLPDNFISDICSYMLFDKYFTKTVTSGTGKAGQQTDAFVWYKFDQTTYKWILMNNIHEIELYISRIGRDYFQAFNKYASDINFFETDKQKKEFERSLRLLDMITSKRNIIHSIGKKLNRDSFALYFDQDQMIMGAKNGIIQLADGKTRMEPHLITGYHRYPITKSVNVSYSPSNKSKYVRQLAYMWKHYFYEDDVCDWVSFWISTSLDGRPKDIMLAFIADGSRGKTSFMKITSLTLGTYAKTSASSLICGKYDSHAIDPIFVSTKNYRSVIIEETSANDVLSDNKLKRNLGQNRAEAHGKYQDAEQFVPSFSMWLGSNFDLGLDNTNDYGALRRIRLYKPKYTYRATPDPSSKFERKADDRFLKEYVNSCEFQEAWLTIMVHYHTILMTKYAGSLSNVPPSATIEKETLQYRCNQDPILNYINSNIVISKDYIGATKKTPEEMLRENKALSDSGQEKKYMEYRLADILLDYLSRPSAKRQYANEADLCKRFCESPLSEFMVFDSNQTDMRQKIVIGIRLIGGKSRSIFDTDEFSNGPNPDTEDYATKIINPTYKYQVAIDSESTIKTSIIDYFNPFPTIHNYKYPDTYYEEEITDDYDDRKETKFIDDLF